MFVDDWTKVAMGNACDELKACADLITTDVDKDGIWNACKSLGLI
jgi:hydroxymethylpyrimidine pyrophosphatase-like HAD family hydrolase